MYDMIKAVIFNSGHIGTSHKKGRSHNDKNIKIFFVFYLQVSLLCFRLRGQFSFSDLHLCINRMFLTLTSNENIRKKEKTEIYREIKKGT